jgi:hypothetical protein
MSLQLAAKHLASHGRGKDKMLVHMDKDEVASLQKIAMAHGGSLTINPQTGLPEAGFLSAILPMVAGAGLMMIPGMQAWGAGAIVGALKTAQSGSLKQGIMAGLGAYGGAGMAGSAGAAGASSVTPTTITPPPAPVIPEGVANFGPNMSPDAFSAGASTPVGPSAITSTTSGIAGATPYTPTPAVQGTGNINGLTETNAQSFGASNPNAGIQGAQPPAQGISNAAPVSEQASVRAIDNATIPKDFNAMSASERAQAIKNGASFSNAADWASANPKTAVATGASVAYGMKKDPAAPAAPDKDMGQRYSFTGGKYEPAPAPDVPTYDQMMYGSGNFGRQQKYFKQPTYTPISADEAKNMYHFAGGGPVELMSNQNAVGANTMYPMANMTTSAFATPYQDPRSTNMMSSMAPSGGGTVDAMSGEPNMQGTRLAGGGIPRYGFGGRLNLDDMPSEDSDRPPAGPLEALLRTGRAKQADANPGLKYAYNPDDQQYVQQQATGGLSDAHYNLGGYSDGGRLLRGPGDGVSDSIPAVIGKKQPARLADGEFVVPARIVSELGNGSTEAGARKLYAMMDRIQASRKNTVGKGKVAKNNRADKHLPA